MVSMLYHKWVFLSQLSNWSNLDFLWLCLVYIPSAEKNVPKNKKGKTKEWRFYTATWYPYLSQEPEINDGVEEFFKYFLLLYLPKQFWNTVYTNGI